MNTTALLLGKLLTHSLLILGLLLGSGAAQAVGGITSDEAAPHYATNQNREDLEDLRVKVLGGEVRMTRRWDGKQWQWNERWSDLGAHPDKTLVEAKIEADAQPATGGTITTGGTGGSGGGLINNATAPYFLYRNGQAYRRSDDRLNLLVYENQLRLTITRLDEGYRWQDQDGNRIRYDAYGRMLHYEDRNAVRVSVERDSNGYLTAIRDHHGTVVITYGWEAIPNAAPVKNLDGDDYTPQRLVSLTDYTGRQVLYGWDDNNQLTQVTDVRGQVWTYAYATNGALTSQTDPDGRITRYSISAKGIVSSRIDENGAGHSYRYRYDDAKEQHYLSSTDQVGTVTEHWYNGYGIEVRREINGDLQFTAAVVLSDNSEGTENLTKRYSSLQQRHTAGTGGGGVRVNAADGPHYLKRKTVTDARGHKTVYEYDQWKNVLKVTYPDGATVSNTWTTPYARPLTTTDERGVVTTYAYDDRGNLLTLTEAKDTADERVTRYTYDAYGQVKTITTGESAANHTPLATTTYDYDAYGNVTAITDALNQVMTFSDYDALGHAATLTDARANALPVNQRYTWTRTVDAAGNLLSERDPDNRGTTYTYTPGGHLASVTEANNSTTTFTNNSSGLPLTITDIDENITALEYDKADRLITVKDPNGNIYRLNYDHQDNLISTVDGENHITKYDYAHNLLSKTEYPTFHETLDYDNRDRVKESRQQANNQTYLRQRGYDLASNLTGSTDANGSKDSYQYDNLGRMINVTDAGGGVTTYRYDARDNQIEVRDPEGRLTVYRYDLNDQLLSETKHDAYTSGGDTTAQQRRYTYDANGNLTSSTNPAQEKISYTYDTADRLIATSVYATTSSTQPLKVINYQINAQNQFTGYTQAAGTTPEGNPAPGLTPDILPLSETYTYTALNQVETVTVNLGGFSKTYAYTYYPNGLKHTYTNPEGITYTYYYDRNDELTAVHIPGHGQLTYSDFEWLVPKTLLLPGGSKLQQSYDDFLQVEQYILKDPADNQLATATYACDMENNITRITNEFGIYKFDYDKLYRLTRADYPLEVAGNDEAFAYDEVGNRTEHTLIENIDVASSEIGDDDDENPPVTSTMTMLVYNNQNQLTQGTSDDSSITYTYNANGHTATKTENGITTEYMYNHEERLIAVRVNGTTVSEYAYNPYGMRIKKTTYANGTATTTWYLYNDKGLAAEYDSSGNLLKEYHFHPQKTWMTDPLFQRAADSQVYYYQNDHLGTPQRLIRSNGATVWRATYTAFGEATVDPDSTIENNLRFPGQYYDAETGLHHNFHRDYDPKLGRYVQSDPIGLLGGINTYNYSNGNPINYVDPLGLNTERTWCARWPQYCTKPGSGPDRRKAVKDAKEKAKKKPKNDRKKKDENDHGNCTATQKAKLQAQKDKVCNQPRACNYAQSCEQLSVNYVKNMNCVVARELVMNTCYNGGDRRHVPPRDDALDDAEKCWEIMKKIECEQCK